MERPATMRGLRCRGCGQLIGPGEQVFVSPPDSFCEPCGQAQQARRPDLPYDPP
jgi:hypothetical protein